MNDINQLRGNIVTGPNGHPIQNAGAFAGKVNTPAEASLDMDDAECSNCGETSDTAFEGVPYCDYCRGEMCDDCGADLSDGQGWNGLCGDCADRKVCTMCSEQDKAEGSDTCSDCARRIDELSSNDIVTVSHANGDFDTADLHVDGFDITGADNPDDPNSADGVIVTAYRWEDLSHLEQELAGSFDDNAAKVGAALAEIAPGWKVTDRSQGWDNVCIEKVVPPHDDYWSDNLDNLISWMHEHPFVEDTKQTFPERWSDALTARVNSL
ncbi:hypothetical protein ACFVAJ_18710 [Agromyces sp. NPDC057679]|uniref:hypothetical protein n=1 Tax=Agromyces sp. NPDC057679 TaxID=3346207 RepID=UPI00366FFF98